MNFFKIQLWIEIADIVKDFFQQYSKLETIAFSEYGFVASGKLNKMVNPSFSPSKLQEGKQTLYFFVQGEGGEKESR